MSDIKVPPNWLKEPHIIRLPDQKGLQFSVSKKQALLVFDRLIERLSEKGAPYNTALVPQANHAMPVTLVEKVGKRDHAIYLFILCLWMRGGTESDTAMNFLAPLYDARPELFVPEYFIMGQDNTIPQLVREVADALNEYKLNQRVEENSVGWVYNMRKLATFWQGDPRNLMKDKPDFKTLCSRVISKKKKTQKGDRAVFVDIDKPGGFMYFQEKMAGMIAYFLMDAKLVPMFYAPVPVDIHVLRILVTNGIIYPKGKRKPEDSIGIDFYREAVRAHARDITEWYCRERKVSPVALCDTLWLLSRSFCRRNPGNSGYVVDKKRKDLELERRATARNSAGGDDLLLGFGDSIPDVAQQVKSSPEELETDTLQTELALSEDDAGELKGRKRYMGFRFHPADIWSTAHRVERFDKSCGRCPVQSTCLFNITSAAYYVAGQLLPERLRLKPPAVQEDLLDHPAFCSAHNVLVDPRVRFAPIPFDEGEGT